MKKYLFTIKLGFMEMLSCRTQMALWTIIALFPPLFSLIVFRNFGEKIDQNFVTTYFLLLGIVQSCTFLFIDGIIANQIFEGSISHFLIKPYSFIKSSIAKYCTAPLVKCILGSPFIIFVLVFLTEKGYLAYLTFPRLILFLLSLIGGLFINLSFVFMVGLSTFWFQKAWFLSDLNRAIIFLFSGATIPLFVFPEKVLKIIRILPFRYMLSFQIEILLSPSLPSIASITTFLSYIILLWIIVFFMYQKGLKKYEAYGN